MHLSQLRLITIVAEEKSMSQAAKKLHLSQPAISSQIKSIEQYFNTHLFERTPQGIEPTPAGEIVLKYAREIINTFTDLEDAIHLHLQNDICKLILGASTTIGNYPLPCSVFLLKEKYPKCDIQLDISNSDTILAKLKNAEVDLAMIEGPINDPQLVTRTCLTDELILVAPNKEPWLNQEVVTLKDLPSLPLIIREKGSGIRNTMERFLNKHNLTVAQLNIVTELTSIESIKSAVERGHGLTFLPKMALRKELFTKTIKALTIKDQSITINYDLIYRQNQIITPLIKEFISLVLNQESTFC